MQPTTDLTRLTSDSYTLKACCCIVLKAPLKGPTNYQPTKQPARVYKTMQVAEFKVTVTESAHETHTWSVAPGRQDRQVMVNKTE